MNFPSNDFALDNATLVKTPVTLGFSPSDKEEEEEEEGSGLRIEDSKRNLRNLEVDGLSMGITLY
ncbi:hypothetical protein TorRG33x02_262110 [Trema orientale]|uniref:Uncharacterized protein n=1 Tax=Trema orientale TaxID=63057 RepID=A0A2P5D5A0_TREOI|nr:hypothetical protein TorRG33x02_262110 [Trema orientale]